MVAGWQEIGMHDISLIGAHTIAGRGSGSDR